MTPADLDHTIMGHINEKAQELEEALDCDVVAYFGQIHPTMYRPFRNFIEMVSANSERVDRRVAIVLRTPGGSAETAERMVSVLRHHYDHVSFIVPDTAMSAGTIMCMAGDKIYMDYSSSLGPIDPQVLLPDGSGYVPALGYLDKVKELAEKQTLFPADAVLLKSIDLGKLAVYEQARNLSVSLLKRWLVNYKFRDWVNHRTTNPGQPVTEEEKAERAEQIAQALSDNKLWHSHGRHLSVDTFRELRLEIDDYSENDDLRSRIRGYNDLLTAYSDRMQMAYNLHSHLIQE